MNSTAHVEDGVRGRMPEMFLRGELMTAWCKAFANVRVAFSLRGSSTRPRRGWNPISTVNNPKPKTN